jgi:hypothetical protein
MPAAARAIACSCASCRGWARQSRPRAVSASISAWVLPMPQTSNCSIRVLTQVLEGRGRRIGGAVAEQQQGAGAAPFRKQRQGEGHDLLRGLALAGQHAHAECVQIVQQHRGVVAQWQHRVGTAGVGDQARVSITARVDKLQDLVPGALQTARLHVALGHGLRQVDGDHQRRVVLGEGRLATLPARSGEGDDQQRAEYHRYPERREQASLAATHDHPRQQVRGDDRLPLAAQVVAPPLQQAQHHEGQQQQQPGGAQEVEGGQRIHHTCTRRRRCQPRSANSGRATRYSSAKAASG